MSARSPDSTTALPETTGPLASLRRNLAWLLLSQGCTVGGGFLYSVLAAHRLTTVAFADLLIITGVAGFLFGTLTGSVAFRIVRDHAAAPSGWSRPLLRWAIVRSLLLALPAGLLAALTVGLLRGQHAVVPALLWSGNQMLTLLLATITARFAARDRMEWIAGGAFGYAALANLVLIATRGTTSSLTAVAAVAFGSQFIVTILIVALARLRLPREDPLQMQPSAEPADLLATTVTSGGLLGATRVDYLVLGQLSSIQLGAAYTASLRIVDYFRLLPPLLINAANPSVNRVRVQNRLALGALASRHLLVFALTGMAGAMVLRGIGAPLLAAAFALSGDSIAPTLAVVSLALPFDMLVWHAAWYLLTLGRSWLAASLQVLGLVAHAALAIPLAADGGANLGYALVAALALSAVVSQFLLTISLRSGRLTHITLSVAASTMLLLLLPVPTEGSPYGVMLAAVGLLIGGLALLAFSHPGRTPHFLAVILVRYRGLERRQLLYTGPLLFVAACAGLLTAMAPFLALLAVAVAAAVAFVTRPPHLVVAIAVFVTTATYRGVFFRARLDSPVGPIGLYDVLWFLVLVAVVGTALRPPSDRLLLPMAAFVLLALLSAVNGVVDGQPAYNVLKLLRAQMFLFIGYIAARALTEAGRTVVIRAILLGGVITAAQQVITFLFALQGVRIWTRLGLSAFDTGDAYVSLDFTNSSIFRDNGVTINFAVLSTIIILSGIVTRRHLLPRSLIVTSSILALAGIVVSLTRTVWLGLTLGVIVIILCTGLRGTIRLTQWFATLAVVSVAGVVVLELTTGMANQSVSLLEERFETLFSGGRDRTVGYRLSEAGAALQQLRGRWLFGVGAADVSVWETGRFVVRNQLHNGYAQYLLAGGVVGLASIVIILVLGAGSAVRGVVRARNEVGLFRGIVLSACLVVLLFIAFVGGVVNDAFQTPIVGLLLGLATTAPADRVRSAKSDMLEQAPPTPVGMRAKARTYELTS